MKADRLVGIIMTLLDKQRVSAQALADTFEVSLRTIYRDMDAISAAGIPIRAAPGVGGGFEIMPGYQVDKTVFSADDLAALLSGLSSLSSMVPGSEPANALAKVRRFLPAGRAGEIELKQTRSAWIAVRGWAAGTRGRIWRPSKPPCGRAGSSPSGTSTIAGTRPRERSSRISSY